MFSCNIIPVSAFMYINNTILYNGRYFIYSLRWAYVNELKENCLH